MTGMSEYEQERLARLRENAAMLASLGLLNALHASAAPPKPPRKKAEPKKRNPGDGANRAAASLPSRRSNRISKQERVSYIEIGDNDKVATKDNKDDGDFDELEEIRQVAAAGHHPEVYTVANLNGLGTCTISYHEHPDRMQLGDGYGNKGGQFGRYKKIEKVPGCTGCHWCRHSSLDPKCRCACGSMYCGPCLQGRYGENVLEIICDVRQWVHIDPMRGAKKPEWKCPKCRQICNCSSKTCLRWKWGWGPTGALAHVAQGQNYDSVAHYKIMGQFDGTVVELEIALAEEDIARLRLILKKVEYMELDAAEPGPEIRQRVHEGAEPVDDEDVSNALFVHGYNAPAVVSRLKALVAQAQEMVAAHPEPEEVEGSADADAEAEAGAGEGEVEAEVEIAIDGAKEPTPVQKKRGKQKQATTATAAAAKSKSEGSPKKAAPGKRKAVTFSEDTAADAGAHDAEGAPQPKKEVSRGRKPKAAKAAEVEVEISV